MWKCNLKQNTSKEDVEMQYETEHIKGSIKKSYDLLGYKHNEAIGSYLNNSCFGVGWPAGETNSLVR